MTGWNFDMTAAPRSYFRKETRTKNGKPYQVDVLVSVKVIVANDGELVTTSRWLPPSKTDRRPKGRWEGFTVEKPPVAWMPMPDHPAAEQAA